ncbi:hypothetical protein LUW74_01690 [Actinomadura madurae]|uniref:hypothetical protein n=1 Tax=Actinomadura madurae TaxID=1993 RepID=UPI002025CD64|nr:hypothetical protein [Actinomadura madurae]URN02217.1 hypothetical protein LUW74_01690 [Actinomadura madurae]
MGLDVGVAELGDVRALAAGRRLLERGGDLRPRHVLDLDVGVRVLLLELGLDAVEELGLLGRPVAHHPDLQLRRVLAAARLVVLAVAAAGRGGQGDRGRRGRNLDVPHWGSFPASPRAAVWPAVRVGTARTL